MRMGGQRHALAALLPRRRPGTQSIEGWEGPRAGLDVCGNSLDPSALASRYTDNAIPALRFPGIKQKDDFPFS